MKKIKLLVACLGSLLIFSFCNQPPVEKKMDNIVVNPFPLGFGHVDTLRSKILGETRTLWIYVPDSIHPAFYTNRMGYPVLYLLDAEASFHSVVGTLHNLSRDAWNSRCPQMIVVGITAQSQISRFRDLSPTHVDSALFVNKEQAAVTGGGENFISFLQKELFPYIESKYKTQPYRLLVGHSLGGLFALHTMFNHKKLFNSYIAIDPSLHWDNQKLLKQMEVELKQKNWTGSSLFLAMARNWEAKLDTSNLRTDRRKRNENARCILNFIDALKENHSNGLNWSYKYYQDEEHITVPHLAVYNGLRYIFRHYEVPTYNDLYTEHFNSDSIISMHYDQLYKESGYRFIPPEVALYSKIINLLGDKETEKALPLIKIMLKHYPNIHGYWCLGEYHKIKGDTTNAIKYFSEALSYMDDQGIRQELNELKK